MESCAECGYDYTTVGREGIAERLREFAGRYSLAMTQAEDRTLTAHRRDGVWSPLEYACHVRDVLAVQRERIALAQVSDEPTFTSMRREERVLEEGYNEQDPAAVADQIVARADELASTFEALDDGGWERTGVYNWPTTQVRTVEWIGRHTIHELVHHLMDIGRGIGGSS